MLRNPFVLVAIGLVVGYVAHDFIRTLVAGDNAFGVENQRAANALNNLAMN